MMLHFKVHLAWIVFLCRTQSANVLVSTTGRGVYLINSFSPWSLVSAVVIGRQSLAIGRCSLFIVHWSLFIVHCSLVIVHCSLFIGHWPLFIGHRLLVIVHWSDCWSLIFGHWSCMQQEAVSVGGRRGINYPLPVMQSEVAFICHT